MMKQQSRSKPKIPPEDRVVLFDGVCRLCSFWARFLIRFDKKRRFKLATVQSPDGQAILESHGFSKDYYKTMLLVEGGNVYTKSSAFFRVMFRLPWPWPFVCIGWVVPSVIRDWLYDRVALNRYKLFGRHEACVIPDKDHESRFLGE
ncbi:thiol-disulfide oxidoreductase DCC family protein [Alcanivorax sp. ST75FaO-1]|nr:thiol-disulfide oxidoreductase DCC family protein [Alloalcanivorax profundimaris]